MSRLPWKPSLSKAIKYILDIEVCCGDRKVINKPKHRMCLNCKNRLKATKRTLGVKQEKGVPCTNQKIQRIC